MNLSLIITTYNRPDALSLVLKSVLLQTKKPFEVIIADDGSKDETKVVVEKFKRDSGLKILHSWQEDKGFRASMARNRAVAEAEGEYVVLIDGDMVLHRDFVSDHIDVAERGVFVQGSRVLLDKSLTERILKSGYIEFKTLQRGVKNRKNGIHSKFLSRLLSNSTKSLKGIRSCNFALFRDDILKVNGFDNSFVGWGREDSEFAVRLLNSGMKRRNVKFLSIAYHLYHDESSKSTLSENDERLRKSIEERLVWAEDGVDRFLKV
jgi:glycosyltransferase involved in cell wall biosynthesis